MLLCKECKTRLFPSDPTIRLGFYRLSTCEHYCNKSQYDRDLEQMEHTQVIEHRHSDMSKQDFARLNNLEGQVKYLQGKIAEKQERKQVKSAGYKGIK